MIRVAGEAGGHGLSDVLKLGGQVFSIGAWLTIICSVGIIAAAMVKGPLPVPQGQKSTP